LEFRTETSGAETGVKRFVALEDGVRGAIGNWFGQNGITIIIVENNEVVIAIAGWGNEPPGLVRVDLTSRFQ
jgi:hypothetical protein